jgi:hypothetical protein
MIGVFSFSKAKKLMNLDGERLEFDRLFRLDMRYSDTKFAYVCISFEKISTINHHGGVESTTY